MISLRSEAVSGLGLQISLSSYIQSWAAPTAPKAAARQAWARDDRVEQVPSKTRIDTC